LVYASRFDTVVTCSDDFPSSGCVTFIQLLRIAPERILLTPYVVSNDLVGKAGRACRNLGPSGLRRMGEAAHRRMAMWPHRQNVDGFVGAVERAITFKRGYR
jgi:hypothetical protein